MEELRGYFLSQEREDCVWDQGPSEKVRDVVRF